MRIVCSKSGEREEVVIYDEHTRGVEASPQTAQRIAFVESLDDGPDVGPGNIVIDHGYRDSALNFIWLLRYLFDEVEVVDGEEPSVPPTPNGAVA